jgi:hypothetical protein
LKQKKQKKVNTDDNKLPWDDYYFCSDARSSSSSSSSDDANRHRHHHNNNSNSNSNSHNNLRRFVYRLEYSPAVLRLLHVCHARLPSCVPAY